MKELLEAWCAAGDDVGGERTGGDIQAAEGSGDQVLCRTNSSEDEAAEHEMMTRRRCQDE